MGAFASLAGIVFTIYKGMFQDDAGGAGLIAVFILLLLILLGFVAVAAGGLDQKDKGEAKDMAAGCVVIGIGLAVVCFFAWLFYGDWQHILSVGIAGILFLVGLAIYFVPTIVAWKRNHKNRVAIFALNLLTGWTFVGWVISLVWALKVE